MTPILQTERLEITLTTRDGSDLHPVREVSLGVEAGETLALVGESGCGKSMTCLAIAGLLPKRARPTRGRIVLDGHILGALTPREAFALRRRSLAVVFQDATNCLNPVKTIGWQIAEAAVLRAGLSMSVARREAVRLLERVGMPSPADRAREFPFQLSGGMNQRAMIALAIAGNPKVLIADEATTALDVTMQAQILDLLSDLQREMGMALVFVTHDLGIVAQIADRVAVMYAGRVVETAPVRELFAAPRHPYTEGLLRSLTRHDRVRDRLTAIDGQVPSLGDLPAGCAFAPRCERASARCARSEPAVEADRMRGLACHNPVGVAA